MEYSVIKFRKHRKIAGFNVKPGFLAVIDTHGKIYGFFTGRSVQRAVVGPTYIEGYANIVFIYTYKNGRWIGNWEPDWREPWYKDEWVFSFCGRVLEEKDPYGPDAEAIRQLTSDPSFEVVRQLTAAFHALPSEPIKKLVAVAFDRDYEWKSTLFEKYCFEAWRENQREKQEWLEKQRKEQNQNN